MLGATSWLGLSLTTAYNSMGTLTLKLSFGIYSLSKGITLVSELDFLRGHGLTSKMFNFFLCMKTEEILL